MVRGRHEHDRPRHAPLTGGPRPGTRFVPAALLLPLLAGVYLDGPPPGHTGGFGEPTCRECHFDGPVEDPSVTLELRGVPARWEPGARYPVEVVLTRPGLAAGGFQLAARRAGGPCAGEQAGGLAGGERVAVVDSAGILYAQHALGGTRHATADTIRWRVTWSAPRRLGSDVVFHVAANAADGDESALGDRVVTAAARSRSTAAGCASPAG